MNEPPKPVPWSKLQPQMAWQQGEHVTLVGPTGQGKTILMKALLPPAPPRSSAVVIRTKAKDDSLDSLARRGYRVTEKWDPTPADRLILLAPKLVVPGDVANQAVVVRQALNSIFQQGSWTVGSDEARYICQQLRCEDIMTLLWLQGRSLGISMVAATQRPRWLPLEAFSQATHLFLWRNRDKYDTDRLAGLGTLPSAMIRETIGTLPKFHCLYINTRDDYMAITKAPAPRAIAA